MENNNIKQKIIDEISKTEKSIVEYKEMTKPIAPDNAIGRVSRMDSIVTKSITEATLRQAEEKLINLKRVFSKLDSSDFGICLRCRQPIPIARILYRPESLYCVNCAK